MQTAKLFKNGRSQAVRLPKEFRFEGEEVYVRREGKSIVLSPKDQPQENPWKDFFEALDSLDPTFRFVRDQPRRQQKRASIESRLPLRRMARKSPS
jgi:antitoxin VapB